ncbi:hypothetical protein C7B64_14785 [Merismopedia glauca CCAP 1448/3]|uniref:Uncharacterized protein n=1 Tax=Merismopedia glauca CCAP 1448/3 TaxID=1296344 RepID=A0A2T1C1K3_9CYAN|nr:hypothetical protein C7B64_14785 [Merismopedia glauca CCAP 1448/3]
MLKPTFAGGDRSLVKSTFGSRDEIARDAQESIAQFKAGKLKPQSAEAVIAELRRSLDEDSDA